MIKLFSCTLSLQALEKIYQKNAALCIDLCSRLLTSLEDKTNTLFIVEYLLQQLSSKIRAERIKQLRLLRLGCMVHISLRYGKVMWTRSYLYSLTFQRFYYSLSCVYPSQLEATTTILLHIQILFLNNYS